MIMQLNYKGILNNDELLTWIYYNLSMIRDIANENGGNTYSLNSDPRLSYSNNNEGKSHIELLDNANNELLDVLSKRAKDIYKGKDSKKIINLEKISRELDDELP